MSRCFCWPSAFTHLQLTTTFQERWWNLANQLFHTMYGSLLSKLQKCNLSQSSNLFRVTYDTLSVLFSYSLTIIFISKVDWEVGQKSYCLTIQRLYVMLYAIWYHLFNLKNMKSTHGWVSNVNSYCQLDNSSFKPSFQYFKKLIFAL